MTTVETVSQTNDFDLHMDNDQATGITRIGSIYYVVDNSTCTRYTDTTQAESISQLWILIRRTKILTA